jgi:hypothetical protein
VHPCIILQIEPTWCTIFLHIFLAFLHMFQATMCPSSGENTIPKQHLVFVTLYRWMSGMQGRRNYFIPPCIPDSHLYRVTNTRCHLGTVFSPDGHIVARNIQRKAINIFRKILCSKLVLFTRCHNLFHWVSCLGIAPPVNNHYSLECVDNHNQLLLHRISWRNDPLRSIRVREISPPLSHWHTP